MPYLVSVILWAVVLSLVGWVWGWLWQEKFFKGLVPMQGKPNAKAWTWLAVLLAAFGFWYVWAHKPDPFSLAGWLGGAVLGIILWLVFVLPVHKVFFVWNQGYTKRQFWVDNGWWLTMLVIWGILLPWVF